MIERDADRLRESFQALRREDATGLPPFAATLAAARARPAGPRRYRSILLAATAAVASVAVALLVTQRDRHSAAGAIDLAAVHWEAPTDFLLKLPGDELLRTVPQLGRMSLDRRTL